MTYSWRALPTLVNMLLCNLWIKKIISKSNACKFYLNLFFSKNSWESPRLARIKITRTRWWDFISVSDRGVPLNITIYTQNLDQKLEFLKKTKQALGCNTLFSIFICPCFWGGVTEWQRRFIADKSKNNLLSCFATKFVMSCRLFQEKTS